MDAEIAEDSNVPANMHETNQLPTTQRDELRELRREVKRFKVINAKRIRETEEARMEARWLREILNGVGITGCSREQMQAAADHFSQRISVQEMPQYDEPIPHEKESAVQTDCRQETIETGELLLHEAIDEPEAENAEEHRLEKVLEAVTAFVARANGVTSRQREEIENLRSQHDKSRLSMSLLATGTGFSQYFQLHTYTVYNAVEFYYNALVQLPLENIERLVDRLDKRKRVAQARRMSNERLRAIARQMQEQAVTLILNSIAVSK